MYHTSEVEADRVGTRSGVRSHYSPPRSREA